MNFTPCKVWRFIDLQAVVIYRDRYVRTYSSHLAKEGPMTSIRVGVVIAVVSVCNLVFADQLFFKVKKINMIKTIKRLDGVANLINRRHVLLCTQYFWGKEASWVVYNSGLQIHNFEVIPFSPYELLNRPPIKSWLLWHRKWRHKRYES